MQKSLKAPFHSYKRTDDRDWSICCSLLDAQSTGFGPKRLGCSIRPLFPIEHGRASGHVLVRTLVAWSPCLQATTVTVRFNSKVQKFNSSDRNAVTQFRWKCTSSIGKNGGRECLSFLGIRPFDSVPRRLQLQKI